jgi:hypothetical protein
MTGTRRDQPLPRQDCVGYLLNLKPGADLTAEDLARLARLDDGPFDPDQHDDPYGAGTCRDVAGALARHPSARWCITLIGTDGHPVAHGCPVGRARPTGQRPAGVARGRHDHPGRDRDL